MMDNAESRYSDLDMAYAILADVSASLDELQELAIETEDPELKALIERMYDEEKQRADSIRAWISSHESGQDNADVPGEVGDDIEPEGAGETTAVDDDDVVKSIRKALEESDESDDEEDTSAGVTDDDAGAGTDADLDAVDGGEGVGDEPPDGLETVDVDSEGTDGEDEDEDDADRSTVVEKRIKLVKGDQQIVYGIVLEPGTVDLQGDTLTPSEIRKAAHNFMMKSQRIGVEHVRPANTSIIESYIAPVDFSCNGQPVRKGSWVMAVKIHDPELWDAVKRGEITGFSIAGTGVRTPL